MLLEIYSIVTTLIVVFLLLKMWRMFNLIKKLEDFIIDIKDRSERAISKMKEVDSKGHFESDDEIGWTFDHIKAILNDLNNLLNPKETDIN